MKTAFVLRHQHHGVLWQFVFEEKPTLEQIGPIKEMLDAVHRPGWLHVFEVKLLGAKEIPSIPKRGDAGSSSPGAKAKTPEFEVQAVGTVSGGKE